MHLARERAHLCFERVELVDQVVESWVHEGAELFSSADLVEHQPAELAEHVPDLLDREPLEGSLESSREPLSARVDDTHGMRAEQPAVVARLVHDAPPWVDHQGSESVVLGCACDLEEQRILQRQLPVGAALSGAHR